jgi:hypothetical protein
VARVPETSMPRYLAIFTGSSVVMLHRLAELD